MTRSAADNEWITIDAKIWPNSETAKAIRATVHKVNGTVVPAQEPTWFPKSHIREIEYGEESDGIDNLDTFEATDWICNQKGLIHLQLRASPKAAAEFRKKTGVDPVEMTGRVGIEDGDIPF
jgi:hypothetical protein